MSTTVLPAIPQVGGFITQKVLASITFDENGNTKCKSKSAGSKSKQVNHYSLASSKGKDEDIIDTAKYRNTLFHNICVEMLKDGFHGAFRELFNIVQSENEKQEVEDHSIEYKVPIKEDEQKLMYLKEMLIQAEKSKRRNRFNDVYEAQVRLAEFFSNTKDYWLADHMYSTAYTTSLQVRNDSRKTEAEANCNLGRCAERNMDYSSAQRYYEEFHRLSVGKSFMSGESTFHQIACHHLKDIYIALSEQIPVEDKKEVLLMLDRAYKIAKEGNDLSVIADVAYLIGKRLEAYGDPDTALHYHKEYYEIAQSHNNVLEMAKACQAMGYDYQKKGEMDEAIEKFRNFKQLSDKCGDTNSRKQACRDLGWLYDHMGKYEQAANFFKKAFELTDKDDLESDTGNMTRCEYAISLAHGLLNGAVDNILKKQPKNLDNMLHWKCERLQTFSSDNITYNMYETMEQRLKTMQVSEERRNSRKESLRLAEEVHK